MFSTSFVPHFVDKPIKSEALGPKPNIVNPKPMTALPDAPYFSVEVTTSEKKAKSCFARRSGVNQSTRHVIKPLSPNLPLFLFTVPYRYEWFVANAESRQSVHGEAVRVAYLFRTLLRALSVIRFLDGVSLGSNTVYSLAAAKWGSIGPQISPTIQAVLSYQPFTFQTELDPSSPLPDRSSSEPSIFVDRITLRDLHGNR